MKRAAALLAAVGALAPIGAARAADVPVASAAELAAALGAAKAGDTIVLAAGTYDLTDASCRADGTAAAPITVRSASPLAAKVRFSGVEGFKVTGASWRFEGLDVQGVCATDSACEHAFHVSGGATGFELRGSRVVDFNAQLKVNSARDAGGVMRTPHGGLVEGNELYDTHARATGNPTTKLNIDTGDGWVVRANFIHDFQKGGGDNVSYGAFMKSGGKGGVFERNLVWCERTLKGGVTIGLSFGGGGTANEFCAPAFDPGKPCDPEHTGGTMRNNVVVGCSDVGIYLNRSQSTKILHNTLIATSGVDFRYASSTGEARGNVLAGKMRARDGASFTAVDNLTDVPSADFASWYVDPTAADLRKKGDLGALVDLASQASVTDDFCGRARAGKHDLGAVEHSLGDCDTTRVYPGGPGGGFGADGGAAGSDGGGGSSSGASGASSGGASSGGGASPGAGDDGGCSCVAAGRGRGALGLALALAVALTALGRARRRPAR